MDNYKRNRLIGLIIVGVIVILAAIYYFWLMTPDNSRIIDGDGIEIPISAEISGPFKYTTFNLPVGYSKYKSALNDISLFESFDPDYALSRLPKKIENIVFSKDGQKAVVFESDAVSYYDVASNKLTEISTLAGGWGSGVFSDDFYTIGYDEASKKDALKVVDLEDGSAEDLVYFIRNLEDYEITIFNEFIFLADQTFIPNVLYLIDVSSASRTNIYEADYIALGDVGSAYFSFAAGETPYNASIKYMDYITQEINEFTFDANILNLGFEDQGAAYFISDSEFSGGRFLDSTNDIVTIEDLTSSYAEPKTLGLYKWDGSYNFIMDLSEILPAIPDRIEARDNVVRILIDKEYWDVKIT
ncbi:hypothetical protein ACFL3T_01070 [Patescibacteria group bacterium]